MSREQRAKAKCPRCRGRCLDFSDTVNGYPVDCPACYGTGHSEQIREKPTTKREGVNARR